MVEANRTVAIPLNVPEESISDFHQTILPYAYCQQETVKHCWPDTPKQPSDLQTSKRDAENALYNQLRDDTDEQLHSNLVQKGIKDASSAISSCKTSWENGDRISKPDFYDRDRPGYTMTYDKRAATYNRYEATFSTVTVDTTTAAHTSQACSHTDCDSVAEENRNGKQFDCAKCGYTVNADYNAAKNIGFRYLRDEVSSPASHTCSSGQATSQLALMSGTLSPSGDFIQTDTGGCKYVKI